MGRSADTSSAARAAAVTPSDATIIPTTRALWIGATGNVAVRMATDGVTATFVGVPTGTILPVQCDRVLSTGTTATSIVAMW